MELILDIIWERHKVHMEWKQTVCAVLLALLCAGLYSYIDNHPEYGEKQTEEHAALSEHTFAVGPLIELPILPAGSGVEDERSDALGMVFGESNYAINIDENDDWAKEDRTGGTESAKGAVKKTAAKERSTKSADKTNEGIKHMARAMTDIAIPDAFEEALGRVGKDANVVTGNVGAGTETPGAVSDKDDTDSKTEEEKEDTEGEDHKPGAGWKHIAGFLVNDKGHVIGYTDTSKFMRNHLVVLPVHGECTGIEKNALRGLETEIHEIYIPANITYIDPDALECLVNLFYIEAAAGNKEFYSESGILYYRHGRVAVCPARLKKQQ